MMTTRSSRRLTPAIALVLLVACGGKPPAASVSAADNAASARAISTLEIVELRPGEGAPIAAGQEAVVQYTGWLYEPSAPDKKGREFDSSKNSGKPFRFVVGAGRVIKGWDQGVLGMKRGGRRLLTIPAALAYGDAGAGGIIPPGATLIFDVDLVAIE